MISASLDLAALAGRLSQKAKAIAEAQVAESRLGKTRSASRWRKAVLLWPLFTKG
ncbi:hypothetical protein OKA06_02235 [Novosphingobium sp. MW5]|nr:hypothetical protein [Novosphingobium sp. MW5]